MKDLILSLSVFICILTMMKRRSLHLGNGKNLENMKSALSAHVELYQTVLLKTTGNSLQFKSPDKLNMNHLNITAAPVFSIIQQTYLAKGTENLVGRGPFWLYKK